MKGAKESDTERIGLKLNTAMIKIVNRLILLNILDLSEYRMKVIHVSIYIYLTNLRALRSLLSFLTIQTVQIWKHGQAAEDTNIFKRMFMLSEI